MFARLGDLAKRVKVHLPYSYNSYSYSYSYCSS